MDDLGEGRGGISPSYCIFNGKTLNEEWSIGWKVAIFQPVYTINIMKLEDAIKQKKPFVNQRERLGVNLIFTSNWYSFRQKEFFKRFDITLQQYNVLRILRGSYPNPISTSEIRVRMLDRMSDVSRIVDRLVKKGLVERSVCTDDKRLVDVVINQQGMNLLTDINEDWNQVSIIMDVLTDEEVSVMNDLLDKLRVDEENLEEA